jgi:hypothetical protein
MLRLNEHVRFTSAETEKMLTIGIDLTGVRTQSAVNVAFARWANMLAQKRPDLLEAIARDLAKILSPQKEPEIAHADDNPAFPVPL